MPAFRPDLPCQFRCLTSQHFPERRNSDDVSSASGANNDTGSVNAKGRAQRRPSTIRWDALKALDRGHASSDAYCQERD
mgnify:CR=1 FL=1